MGNASKILPEVLDKYQDFETNPVTLDTVERLSADLLPIEKLKQYLS